MASQKQAGAGVADVFIHTSLLSATGRQLFGPPGGMDYRAHPGSEGEEDPTVVYRSMLESEVAPLKSLDVMKKTIYSFKNRKIISRWLRDVCSAFHLRSTTLCLSIQLTDAFLLGNLQTLKVDRCQLAAITCLWIAAKFEEMDPDLPGLRKIVDVCDRAYSANEVLEMEEAVLSHFKWCLPHATVVNHLYLQVHMLSNEDLIVKRPLAAQEKTTTRASLLLVDPETNQQSWNSVALDSTATIKDSLPRLCATARIPLTSSLEVYQLFGTDLILAQSLAAETVVSSLSGDANGQLRLYLSPTRNQVASIFADHGSHKILRTVNHSFLDLCDFLTQEVIIHVEFLRLPSHVNASGILGLALCLTASSTAAVAEVKPALKHIFDTLKISASQSLASADLLCAKYKETVSTMPGPHRLPVPQADIRERLSACFDRPLANVAPTTAPADSA